ncbi:MAG: peptidase M22 [Oscillospiraceae bacterium]|nr:peptidase M22 [Oscillospiraceae bacterium]
MSWVLGIDTSNYTTSTALYRPQSGEMYQAKRLLPVKEGEMGLRQSDAVFAHVKALPELMEQLFAQAPGAKVGAVGVSVRPRPLEGSYMPCFLAGESAAASAAAALGVPLFCTSHQEGHIAAALYSAGRLELLEQELIAFHLSGGTTEAVLASPGKEGLSVRQIAGSLDLKAGQAVDRVGAMLGIPFPAGRALEQLALQSGKVYDPRPSMKGADCSLSGLQNQCRDRLAKGEAPCDVARFCLDSVYAALAAMTERVREQYPGRALLYAGGVLSNSIIRGRMERFGGVFGQADFSRDNAAGVAVLAARRRP